MESWLGPRPADVHRRVNLSATLATVHAHGTLPRAEITRRTGLSRSSIAGAIAALAGAGIVTETSVQPTSRVGRPSLDVAATDLVLTAGVTLDVSGVRVGLYALGGREIDSVAQSMPSGYTPQDAAAVVSTLLDQLSAAMVGDSRIIALCAAVPGWVDTTGLHLERAVTLGWRNVDFAALLTDATGHPSRLVYDAIAGLAAERLWGPPEVTTDVVYLYGSPGGIGAAVTTADRILVGHRGHAARLGHLPVDPRGPDCVCGSRGCLTTVVSATQLAAALEVDSLDPDALRTALGQPLPAPARKKVDRLCRKLAVAIRLIVHAYDPATIVMDGYLGVLVDQRAERLLELMSQLHLDTNGPMPQLLAASLGTHQVSAGASHFAFADFLDDPLAAIQQP